MPSYYLSDEALSGKRLEIPEHTFQRLLDAKAYLVAVNKVEELYAVVIESFVRFERLLLNQSLEYLLHSHYLQENPERYFDDVRVQVNVSVLTLLTAGRSFEEQIKRSMDIENIHYQTAIVQVKEELSAQFDNRLEYRIASALRNFAQHSQLPISSFSFCSTNLWEGGRPSDSVPSLHRATVNPAVNLNDLIENKKTRSKTRGELVQLSVSKADLKFTMRGYLAGLSSAINVYRGLVSESMDKSVCRLRSAGKRYASFGSEKFVHLIEKVDNGDERTFFIGESLFCELHQKTERWKNLAQLGRSYVSSQVISRKDTWPNTDERIWIQK